MAGKIDTTESSINKNPFRKTFSAGQFFWYLDTKLLVTAFQDGKINGMIVLPCTMECEYIDKNGVIRSKTFNDYQLSALLANFERIVGYKNHTKSKNIWS